VRSFGKTSLREVKRRLADLGLSLGMDLDALAAGQAQITQYSSEDLEGDDDEEDDLDEAEGAEETSEQN
jgi:DNA-directed RNA polymerase subunit alpha